ncbi:hypothetical protein [Paenibacillus polymyxa]|uniref:hypothetical protein n=1 Tax=Paenibacillus polymyxa TaxID=1406 RepID=UPI00201A08D4|nr:hypothetical protein [Paenibacillus polymyxa]MDU8672269.1 hypothetical protein [Paenibacillus polymyxa]MDU8697178.1 hypothetical protein [Paenibacillus polymyxa]MEE4576705.1 hypothetical protein [Paenibacillus polymyxa]UQQ33960.1 hypothetical protein LMH85_17055 [Paenibacillus polymyxa]URJ70867.1 hypothetical protein MF624_000998 [Paenibacillus polymyxa]
MNNLNVDQILAVLLKEIQNETRKWLIGRPCSEEAFLNRLTEVLAKRRKCDVGTTEVYKVEVEQHILHRKGKNQTDKYGSDLAVTISIPYLKFSKTALLQLKKSENYKTQLLRDQIQQASQFEPIKQRSFVMTIDEVRGGIKVNSITSIEKDIPVGQASKTFECEEWDALSEWIIKWMSCKVGAGNASSDPMPIERLLKKQIINDDNMGQLELDDIYDSNEFELPENFFMTKTWIKYTFKKE